MKNELHLLLETRVLGKIADGPIIVAPFLIGRHSHEEEKKIILGTRLKSFCAGNIVDDVTVIRGFSVSQTAVCSLQMSDIEEMVANSCRTQYI